MKYSEISWFPRNTFLRCNLKLHTGAQLLMIFSTRLEYGWPIRMGHPQRHSTRGEMKWKGSVCWFLFFVVVFDFCFLFPFSPSLYGTCAVTILFTSALCGISRHEIRQALGPALTTMVPFITIIIRISIDTMRRTMTCDLSLPGKENSDWMIYTHSRTLHTVETCTATRMAFLKRRTLVYFTPVRKFINYSTYTP